MEVRYRAYRGCYRARGCAEAGSVWLKDSRGIGTAHHRGGLSLEFRGVRLGFKIEGLGGFRKVPFTGFLGFRVRHFSGFWGWDFRASGVGSEDFSGLG